MKLFASVTLVFVWALSAQAQMKTLKFELVIPSVRVSHSLYDSIRLVDVRQDKRDFGFAYLGTLNARKQIVADLPLNIQLSRAMKALTDTTAQKGELVFLLRQFNIEERIGGACFIDICHFKAILFARIGQTYLKLKSVDTVAYLKDYSLSSKKFVKLGSKLFTDLLIENFTRTPADSTTYAEEDLTNFDILQKNKLPLYRNINYKNGVYKSYLSFLRQVPDIDSFKAEFSKDKIHCHLKRINAFGSEEKIPENLIYAFVEHGQAYIGTGLGYYPLMKKENDFFFTGKVRKDANPNTVLIMGAAFGMIGAGLVAIPGISVYEMKLDYLTGYFIPLQEYQPNESSSSILID